MWERRKTLRWFNAPSHSCPVVFIFQEINKPHRGFRSLYCYFPTDPWYIWVNQMSSRACMRCISLLVWKRFLSAVIFSLLCDTPLMSRGEIRTEVTFCSWKMFSVFSSRTLEQSRCSLLSRFEWSFCVKWKDVWRFVCRVSFTALEFFFLFGKEVFKPSSMSKIHEREVRR